MWASLLSDNFHDFFTEYIPFGEEAVLFFEEREFRKRFPNALNPTSRRPVDTSARVTIPSKSGISSKVTEPEGSDLSAKGPHMSAVDKAHQNVKELVPSPPSVSAVKEQVKDQAQKGTGPKDAPAKPKAEPNKPELKKAEPQTPKPKEETPTVQAASKPSATASPLAKGSSGSPRQSPEVDEPSVFVPITRLDPINIKDADEPLVQDLVKMLNDIITVVNADNASGRYNTTVAKAKSELSAIGRRIKDLKGAEKKSADDRVKAMRDEFDQAAQELVRRLEGEMQNQEGHWKDELDSEKQKLVQHYEEQLKAENARAKDLLEEKSKNQLLEQALALKRQFESGIKDRVEAERNGRLGKLSELSTSSQQLEKLTAEWNGLLEANLKTQHLQVAVEAVRSGLERAERPRPFIRELAALKELAADDAAVNSAIASIHPSAYQRGVPSSAQLIDRFRRVAEEVRKAALLPDNAGLASHAASFALSKVMFKKQGVSDSDDVESVLTRTETLLEEGKLDQAAREINALNGWAKTLSKDWLSDVRKVLEVRQALDVSLPLVCFRYFALALSNCIIGDFNRSSAPELKGGLSRLSRFVYSVYQYCSLRDRRKAGPDEERPAND